VSSPLVLPSGRATAWRSLTIFAFLLELLFFTFWRGSLGPYWSPLLFGGAGLLLGGAALAAVRDQPLRWAPAALVARRINWAALAWLAGTLLVLYRQIPIVLGAPIDVRSSDVIPIVQAYVSRFRSGEVVYRYLTSLPYPLFPNHLPLQWLPYVPAQVLGVDFRWLSLGMLLGLGFGVYQLVLLRRPGSWLSFGVRALLPALMLWIIIYQDYYLYAHVLELTIITYYFLLAASVLSGSAWAQGGALVLCLLSRYSVVFWVPFFLWVLWREAGPRHTLIVALLMAVGVVGIYIVPFFAKDPTIFTHALSEYRLATIGEWSRINPDLGLPLHIGNGLSIVPWLYRFLPLPLEAKISWTQRLHALASAGTGAMLIAFYWRYGRRYDYRYLTLIGLKLYLVVFYFFIQIPYAYLISLSVLLSVFVVLVVLDGASAEAAVAGDGDGAEPVLTT
jgi:hypothetical protein